MNSLYFPNKSALSAYRWIVALALMLAPAAFADGFIVVPPPRDRPQPVGVSAFPLEVKYHHVNVTIDDLTALTAIDQVFYNPTNQRLEGYYIFPIPAGAVIEKFSMFINGQETLAELLDAAKARTIYEDLVRKIIDPALLEYYGQGLFKARIFPIEPNSVKRVRISYRSILSRDNGTIEYRYPLNTEKFSARPVPDVMIKADLTLSDALKNIYCTSHEVDIARKDSRHAAVSFEARETRPDKDFQLYYTTDNSKFGLSLLTCREPDEEGYFFLNISPDVAIKEVDAKDVTFVLDVSGSMAGKKMEQARKALAFCIANLNPTDRFEIIRFSTEAEALFGALTAADAAATGKANAFVKKLQAIGGTNIEEALTMALKERGDKATRRHMILFMTDGKPTIGQTDEQALVDLVEKSNARRTRIFTLGIGEDLNTHLLDKITEATKAYRSYVGTEEDLEIKISNLYTKLQAPVLTDLTLSVSQGVELLKTYPKALPDLFKGSTITILGRYTGNGGAEVTLSGIVNDTKKSYSYTTEFPAASSRHEAIPALWAARRIGFLLDQIRLHGDEKELVDEVTLLAKKFGIITPYTSYLILEDETTQIANNRIRRDEEIFNRMAPPQAAQEFKAQTSRSFSDMKKKSGGSGIAASKELQSLNNATSTDQMRKADNRLGYKDESGTTNDITQQVRQVQGKAMYQAGSQWIDPLAQSFKGAAKQRVQFGSSAYFEFLKKNPQAAQFLALGRSVKFVLAVELIEIYE
jgi:Ca-activated chloride channel family protein